MGPTSTTKLDESPTRKNDTKCRATLCGRHSESACHFHFRMVTALLLLLMSTASQGATLRLGSTRFWHVNGVECACFSPDGKQVWTGGFDGVKVWRLSDGKQLAHHKGDICDLKLTGEGRHLVVVRRLDNRRGRVEVWNLEGKLLHRGPDFFSWVINPRINLFGTKVILTDAHDTLLIWDWKAKDPLKSTRSIKLPNEMFPRIVSSDGKSFVTIGKHCELRRLDGQVIQKWSTEQPWAHTVDLSPDGRWCTFGGASGVIHIRDLQMQRSTHSLDFGASLAQQVRFSPDGKTLAVILDQYNANGHTPPNHLDPIVICDFRTGKVIRRFGKRHGYIAGAVFSSDGRTLACPGDKLTLWDVRTGKEILSETAHRDVVDSVICTPDGKRLISRSQDRSIRVWDVSTGKQLAEFETADRRGSTVHLTPDGKSICWDDHRRIRTVDLKTLKEQQSQAICWTAWRLKTSPDNQWRAGLVVNQGVGIWHRESMSLVKMLSDVERQPLMVRFSPDGNHLAMFSNHVQLVNCKTWKKVALLKGQVYMMRSKFGMLTPHWHSVTGFAFSSDGQQILTTCPNVKEATLTYLDSLEARGVFPDCEGTALPESFSPNGSMVALRHWNEHVELWEVSTRQIRARWSGHENGVQSLCFTPDGKKLITGGADTTILIRDLYSPQASRQKLDSLWGLLGADAEKSYQAMLQMIHRKDEAVTFLSAKLKPSPKLEVKSIADMIRRLDDDNIDIREQTAKEILRQRGAASEGLRKALRSRPTLEMRRRIHKLLKRLSHGITNEQARPLRAIEVLEQVATQKARRLLKRLAAGGASETTRQAKLAIKRMGKVER